jgi:hypothetical protein
MITVEPEIISVELGSVTVEPESESVAGVAGSVIVEPGTITVEPEMTNVELGTVMVEPDSEVVPWVADSVTVEPETTTVDADTEIVLCPAGCVVCAEVVGWICVPVDWMLVIVLAVDCWLLVADVRLAVLVPLDCALVVVVDSTLVVVASVVVVAAAAVVEVVDVV